MTRDPIRAPAPTREPFLGVVGRRLVAAFTVVAVIAVALVTVAALVGTDRGLARQLTADQQRLTTNLADVAARAYARTGSWQTADLGELWAAVAGTGTRATLVDADGVLVVDHGGRRGQGNGMGNGNGGAPAGALGNSFTAPLLVDERQVGRLTLDFPAQTVVAGRPVAWSWVLAAPYWP